MRNKILILVTVFIALIIILFSSGIRNFVSAKSAGVIEDVDAKNMTALLALADSYTLKKDYVKAKEALLKFLESFPDSKAAGKAKKDVETLNIEILFSDVITDDSIRYEIKAGDTLSKIASKFGTTVELVKKSNGIKDDTIFPGRFLKVVNTKFNILVSKSGNTLELRKPNAEIVKTYVVSTGENLSTPEGTFLIEEKLVSPLWYKVGAVVEPGSQEYELGSRWLGLSVPGYGIHGTKDPSLIGKNITKGCVRMRNKDVEELYTIVPSGTEVTIVE
ncbi:MAG: L,D-transpeptidase family protein [Candidatus Omnitrophica bacterium]|nr:L,D-transpeptidase family protein [Candidatus Omnitrophota bacterium]